MKQLCNHNKSLGYAMGCFHTRLSFSPDTLLAKDCIGSSLFRRESTRSATFSKVKISKLMLIALLAINLKHITIQAKEADEGAILPPPGMCPQ